MRILNESLALEPLERLQPHPRNPRRGDVGAIAQSIAAHGWFGAVVAQKSTGYVLAGNHRMEAARRQGAVSVPVLWVDIDDDTALRILLADNRASDRAEYDEHALTRLLCELHAGAKGLAGVGYDAGDLAKLLDELGDTTPSDAEPPAEDQSDLLREQFLVLATCRDESEQKRLLEKLTEEGFACRALIS